MRESTEVKKPGLWTLSLPQVFLKVLNQSRDLCGPLHSCVKGDLTAPHSELISVLSAAYVSTPRCVNHTLY